MQGYGWRSVLGRIPPQAHDSLVAVTLTGLEIMIRGIVRMEEDFLILRGRMAGSTDAGRVIILPFDQINYLGFNKMIAEAELQAMFGSAPAPVVWQNSQPSLPAGPMAEAASEGQPESGTLAAPPIPVTGGGETPGPKPPAPGGKGTAKPGHPSKSLLLARLRARLAGDGAKPP
jgi:hypothetical protein